MKYVSVTLHVASENSCLVSASLKTSSLLCSVLEVLKAKLQLFSLLSVCVKEVLVGSFTPTLRSLNVA